MAGHQAGNHRRGEGGKMKPAIHQAVKNAKRGAVFTGPHLQEQK